MLHGGVGVCVRVRGTDKRRILFSKTKKQSYAHRMSNTALETPQDSWIGMFDAENPKSVISRAPPSLRRAMLEIPENVRQMDEEELLRHTHPPASLCEARIKLWKMIEEFDGMLKINAIFKNRNTFYTLTTNPYRLMFFLTPPVDYLTTQEAILERSLKSLHMFISGDHMWREKTIRKTDKEGNVTEEITKEINIKAVEAARKIYETMSDRLHGAVAMNLRVQGQHAHAIMTPEQKVGGMSVTDIMSLGSGDDGRKDMPPVLDEGEAPPEDIIYGTNKEVLVDEKDVIAADLTELMDDPEDN